jgi:NADH dehydrogenase [ubiquinone] 1 alpha subcomplex assembly factor 7
MKQRKEAGWHEVMIDTDRDSYSTSGPSQTTAVNSTTRPLLRRVLSPTPTAASTVLGLSSPRFNSLPVGSFIEVSPAAFRIARQVAQLVSGTTEPEPLIQHNHKHDVAPNTDESVGGCGLIIDYGGDQVYGDSFRVSLFFTFTLYYQEQSKWVNLGIQATQTCRRIP